MLEGLRGLCREDAASGMERCRSRIIDRVLAPEARCFWSIVAALLLSIAAVAVGRETPIGVLAGFTLLFVLPGYSVLHAAYPNGTGRDIIDVALSIALSTAVTGLAGLALASLPIGLTRESLIAAISGITLLAASICLTRLPRS